jgi:integration host factor subunit beta
MIGRGAAGEGLTPLSCLAPNAYGVEGEDGEEASAMTKQPTLTKADLIEEVLRITELPRKESETIVETIFESIIEALQKGDKIEIRGFGSFRTRQRRGRIGRNPKTGEKVEVPAKKIPFFKPSKELKDFVNSPEAAASAAQADSPHA